MVKQYISGRKAVILFVCMVQTFVVIGLIYGFSVMYAELVNVFSASRTNTALIQGIFILVSNCGGILWAWALKSFGTGFPVVVGSIVASIGFIASAFATNILTIIICTGVIAGMGVSLIYLAAFVTVNVTFHEQPAFPLVLLTVGASLGQMIIPLVYDALISNFHWSGAMILLAGISLNCVPCGLVAVFSEDLFNNHNSKESKDLCSSIAVCDKELMQNSMLWSFLLNVFIISTAANFANWFLVDQMVSLGYTHQLSTLLLSISGSANLIARILSAVVKLRIETSTNMYHLLYTCPIIALAQALILVLQEDYRWMIVACFVHGFGFGLFNGYMVVTVHEFSGHEKYPQAIAQLNVVCGVSNLLSNILGGYFRDSFGNYDVMYEVAIGAALLVTLGVIIMVFMMKRDSKKGRILQSGVGKFIPYNSIE